MTFIPFSNAGEADTSAIAFPIAHLDQDPLRHLLIGSPRAIRHTIHRLHHLHYVEAGLWSPLMAMPGEQLVITPSPGDMLSVLTRSIRFD